MTNKLDSHFAQDGDYLAVLNEMQQGQWGRAVPLLQALQARYPTVSIVDELLHEATLRDKWDKHLSFSPDGQQPAFYSNRTGTRPIWLMRVDGSSQQNLSNNLSDEWDPIWIQ